MTGGTPPYVLSLTLDGNVVATVFAAVSPFVFTGLAPGTYTVTASDSNGCVDTQQAQVSVVSPCGALTPYFLTATYHTGTFYGAFCVNANGDGTYTQHSPGLPVSQRTLTGIGHIRKNQGVTSIQAYLPAFKNLNLVGTTNGTASSFGESGSGFPHLNGTFTLT
jgi:hypothetical protein